jgi:hypothetical protein
MTYIGGVRLRAAMLAGAIAGLGAGLTFATLHAIVIVPIWDRMTWGLASAAVAGAIGGWAFTELYPDAEASLGKAAIAGAKFGGLLWLIVTPVTLFDALLRMAGLNAGNGEYVRVAAAVGLGLLAGALLGRARRGTKRAMAAGAAATLLLVITMAGPVPIANSPRAFGIFLSVLPSSIVAGAIIGFAVGVARRGAAAQHLAS